MLYTCLNGEICCIKNCIWQKNKGTKTRKKEWKKERRIKNNDKLKQNETNSDYIK